MSADSQPYLEAALSIGRRLCRDAIWWGDQCNWLGWAMEPHGGQWITVQRAMGSLVYDGTAGIGLFLARLTRYTDDPIIGETAEAALRQALGNIDALEGAGEYGFYSGLSGTAWCCSEAGIDLGREDLARTGRAAMLRAAGLAPRPDRVDVINGSAGLVPTLLEAARQYESEELLLAAVRHGEQLLASAAQTDQGWSWDTLGMPGERHLLGFAHGASGIACALARLGIATGRSDFLAAAKGGLAYERAHFKPAQGNWPDLRGFVQPTATGEPPCMLAWCHGAPGIGIARAALHGLLPGDHAVLEELEVAVRTTSASLGEAASGAGNFSLCHGEGGNAELLLVAAEVLDRQELRHAVEATATTVLERFGEGRQPWPCGIPGAGETPNLMLGLAGIGYFFLRLHDPQEISTVLLPGAAGYRREPRD